MSGPQYITPRIATYLVGASIVVLLAAAATWMIARDHRAALDNAEQHLENFAIVLADQTAFALRNTPADLLAAIQQGADAGDTEVHREVFQNRMAEVYGGLELAYTGRLMLFRRDGTLLAVFPRGPGLLGQSYAAHALFTHAVPRRPDGIMQGAGLVHRGERVLAYRSVKGYPMVVVISSPIGEILEPWRREALVVGLSAFVLICLTAMATLLLARQLRMTGKLTRDLSESEMRLNSIIGSAMDAIITVDKNQHIVLFNAAAERIFGCSAREAIGSPLEWLIPERFRESHAQHVNRFGEAGVTMRRMGGDLVLAGRRTSGEEFPIDASISYSVVGGRKYYTVILRDITERQRSLEEQRRAARQLEESERRLNSIIESAMDAIITIDEQQKIVLFNVAAERIFRCRTVDAVRADIDRFIPDRYRARHREHVARFGSAGSTTRKMGSELVLTGLRSDGEEFPIDASISHVTVGDRKFFTVILRDITERQRAAAALTKSHQDLRELYESMHEIREAERTRIARELHDELAQWLTALKMDAAWIAGRKSDEHHQVIVKAERMKAVIDDTVAAVRRIAADLRPVMLDDLGLVAAVENLLHEMSKRAGVEVTFRSETNDVDLREPLATAVYRMTQEALTNVSRHANASAVTVELVVSDGALRVRVIDDGQGLKPDPNRKSFGLLGIRERARTLGGDARIYSPPEGGTIVEIAIPLHSGVQPTTASATAK